MNYIIVNEDFIGAHFVLILTKGMIVNLWGTSYIYSLKLACYTRTNSEAQIIWCSENYTKDVTIKRHRFLTWVSVCAVIR